MPRFISSRSVTSLWRLSTFYVLHRKIYDILRVPYELDHQQEASVMVYPVPHELPDILCRTLPARLPTSTSASPVLLFRTSSVSSVNVSLSRSAQKIKYIPACSPQFHRLKCTDPVCSSPSRTEPSGFAAIILSASSDTVIPRFEHISCIPSISTCSGTLLKSSLIHLESIVAGSFWGSVVASMKTTYSGGLLQCLEQSIESSCGQHMHLIYDIHLFLPAAGGYLTLSLSSRILSTPLFDACIYLDDIKIGAFLYARQCVGMSRMVSVPLKCSSVPLPVSSPSSSSLLPRVPQKRYAWLVLSVCVSDV